MATLLAWLPVHHELFLKMGLAISSLCNGLLVSRWRHVQIQPSSSVAAGAAQEQQHECARCYSGGMARVNVEEAGRESGEPTSRHSKEAWKKSSQEKSMLAERRQGVVNSTQPALQVMELGQTARLDFSPFLINRGKGVGSSGMILPSSFTDVMCLDLLHRGFLSGESREATHYVQ